MIEGSQKKHGLRRGSPLTWMQPFVNMAGFISSSESPLRLIYETKLMAGGWRLELVMASRLLLHLAFFRSPVLNVATVVRI